MEKASSVNVSNVLIHSNGDPTKLPDFSFVEQMRARGSAVLDRMASDAPSLGITRRQRGLEGQPASVHRCDANISTPLLEPYVAAHRRDFQVLDSTA
jgi:hypothetical protein